MTVKLVPGVKIEQTPLLLQAGVVQSNNIRWRDGLFEKVGGWVKFYDPPSGPSTLPGPVRELWTWEDLNGVAHLAAAGGNTVSVITGGNLQPVTPQFVVRHPASMQTTAGSPLVTVHDTGSNASTYESVTLQTPWSIGGICILPGDSQIATASPPDSYTANVGQNAVSAATTGTPCTFTSSVNSNLFLVNLVNHGLKNGDNFSIVLPTAVGGVALSGFSTVTVVDANNFTILGPNQATSAQTVNYGNVAAPGIQLIQWVVAIPSPPVTVTASASFVAGYSGIAVPANPGSIVPGMLGVNLSTGTSIGTVAKYGPVTQEQKAWGFSWSIGGTTTNMLGSTNAVGPIIPGMTIFDEKVGMSLGTVVSYIGPVLVWTPAATFANRGGDILKFSSGTQNVLALTSPLTVNSSGAHDVLSFSGAPSPPPTGTASISADDWCMFNFGSTLLINPEDEPIFQYDPTGGVGGARLVPNAPIAHGMFLAMPQQMVVAYGASTEGVQDPMLVAWSDAGDFNTWAEAISNQAGTFRLSRGSKIVGGMQMPMQAMLWTDIGLWAMTFIGYPDTWGFLEIAQECGLIAKKAAGVLGSQVFWMGHDKFWIFSGGQVQPLPCEVWDAIFQNLNTDLVHLIRCATDTTFDGIAWFFPSLATKQQGALQENDSFVKFNRVTGEWDYGTPVDVFGDGNIGGAMISDWIDDNVFGGPISAMTDSTGTLSQLMSMDNGQDADDQPIHWWIRTGLFLLSEGEDFIFVDRCRPDFKWRKFSDPTAPSAEIDITLYAQNYSDNPAKPPVAYGPFTVTDTTGEFDPRARGRYFSLRIEGSDPGSFARMGAVKFRFSPDGRAG
jgi:hypothetical protein